MIEAMQQALEALTHKKWFRIGLGEPNDPKVEAAITALRTAIEAAEKQEPVAWLTKELMADYMDMIAEAIEDNRGEPLRHKAHLLRVRSKT